MWKGSGIIEEGSLGYEEEAGEGQQRLGMREKRLEDKRKG